MQDERLAKLLETADALAGDPPRVRTSWDAIRRRSARRQLVARSAAGLALAGVALAAVTFVRARSGPATSSPTPQQLLAELQHVAFEADLRAAALERTSAAKRASREDRPTHRPAPIDPQITARVQIDRAADQILALGDEYERRLGRRDQAALQYMLLLQAFPESARAAEARRRLDDLGSPQPVLENPL